MGINRPESNRMGVLATCCEYLPVHSATKSRQLLLRCSNFPHPCGSPPVDDRVHTHAITYATIDSWLEQPCVKSIEPGNQHWPILCTLLEQTGMVENLTTDAHIAALALEHGCTVYSADNDFKRFPGLRHINPLAVL